MKTRRVAWNRAGALSLLTVLWVQAAAWMAQAQSPPSDGFNPGANDIVSALAVQADGKIVLGGVFTYVFPDTVAQSRNRLARLYADGSLDSAFNPQANATVYSLAVQPDGKILVGGDLTTLGGSTRTYIGRLNTNGTLDTTFNTTIFTPPPGLTLTARVQAILMQPDGKIVVGGRRTLSGGPTTGYVSRLNTNGTTDTTFSTSGGAGAPVSSLALQPDGKILVGGLFTTLRGQTRPRLGRLNPDGTLDADFNPNVDPTNTSAIVLSLVVQPDGKILVGGLFKMVAGQTRTNLARLNPDGTLDLAFDPVVSGGSSTTVYSLAVQADGKILVGGLFSTVAGQPRVNLARLNPDGTLDSGFNPGANSYVYGLALQGDGKVLVGGQFTMLSGQGRRCIGRLNATDPAAQSLSDDGSTITWLRGGTSPEVWRTTFEVSTNLANWTLLGPGTQISGGWELVGVSLPSGGRIRARGYTAGAGYNASSWFAETISGSCVFLSQPVGRTNNAATAVGFSTYAVGSPPLSYQWLKNAIPLEDADSLSGAQTPALNISSLSGSNAGGYSVIVSNSFGSITSVVATLKVVDPLITAQPVASTNVVGTAVTFSASAQGTAPLTFQWRKNGVTLQDGGNISGAQTPSLTLTNVTGGDVGAYSLRVTNSFGTATSVSVWLTVLDPLIVTQPAARLATPGDTVSFSVTALGTPPVSYRWRRNGAHLSAASGTSLTLSNVTWTDEGTYDVIVTNAFGSVTSAGALLSLNLATADTWVADAGNYPVQTVALQPDGKTVVAALESQRYHLARLYSDGTLETGFDPQIPGSVYSILLQPDGNLLIGGWFNSSALGGFRRCSAGGSLDYSFDPKANSEVYALVMQADGRMLVGGSFSLLGGYSRNSLGRIYTNGILDYSFTPEADSTVYSLAAQTDGRLLVGGAFATLAGRSCKFLGRLNTNCTLDTTFVASAAVDSPVFSLAVQADGKILVARNFTLQYGSFHYPLLRLNPDGSLDSAFNAGNDAYVNSLALEADGKIVLGGNFTSLGGKPRNHIGRLNSDGTLDTQFNPGANDVVNALAIQADGKIVVGGYFGTLAGMPRPGLGRLNATEPATQILELAGSTLTWRRGGTSPEIWSAAFEVSTNGTSWSGLGAGTRVPGGWQLASLSVPPSCTIRARGPVSGGRYNGSTWFVESLLAVDPNLPPKILASDSNFGFQTNQFGFNVAGQAGQVVVVEGSTDFLHWVPLQTNLVTGSRWFLFNDPNARLFARRFYRARLHDGALPAPSIPTGGGSAGFVQGRFGFNVAGISGQTVVVETSPDLASWTALATNTIVTNLFYFTDPGSTNVARRFYRARVQ